MLPISIKFQAFIPNSLGKNLLSYFEGTSRFRLLGNKEEFTRKIRLLDSKGYTWLPEPGGFLTNNYFATDNVDMYHHHSEHSTRLKVEAEIDFKKTGNYNFKSELFKHENHGKDWGGINSQHSGKSHQVKAYIKRIPFYTDMPRVSDKDLYIGVCSEMHSDRSEEDPLDISVRSFKKHQFSDGGNDATKIKVSASAGYPFIFISPNIDFELNIELHKNLSRGSIDMNINGWHNDFPAYELIVRDRVIYSYNPADYGHTGPNPNNLSKSRNFNKTESICLSDWEIRDLKQGKTFGW
jgi:hypothetical protein